MNDPIFTSDWFTHHISFWLQIFKAADWDPMIPKLIVEIGSYEGRSTIWACQNLLKHPDSRIICVDTFEGSVEHSERQKDNLFDRFRSNVLAAGVAEKVILRRGPSWKILPGLIHDGVQADLTYIDGSHQAPDVLEDAVMCYRLTKRNGLILFDDYRWTVEPHGREDLLNAPKLAIDLFFNLYCRRIRLFAESQHQICAQRTEG